MVGITLRQYWESAEQALHTLHERLISEGQAQCLSYLRYRQIMLDMIAIGKVIEELGVFSGLKSKGEELEKKPSEFGLDKLPEPHASYAAREFSIAYCAHLKYFVQTNFVSSNRLINLALPGQKPALQKQIDALEAKIESAFFVHQNTVSLHPINQEEDLSLESRSELKPLPAEDFELVSMDPQKQFNLPHELCIKFLKAYDFFSDFKSILNTYLLKSRLTRIQASYEEIANEAIDIQLILRIKEIEKFLNLCGQPDRVLTSEDIINFQSYKILHSILLKIKEYETLINPEPEGYHWQDFLIHYEGNLKRLISDIGDQLIGLNDLPVKSKGISILVMDLNSKLIAYSLDNHIAQLNQQSEEWVQKHNLDLQERLKSLLDSEVLQLETNNGQSPSSVSEGGFFGYLIGWIPWGASSHVSDAGAHPCSPSKEIIKPTF